MDLAHMIYELTVNFPAEERYGLSSQMKRAAVSIPSNISEGAARNTTKELLHYIAVARGSAAELSTQLELVQRLKIECPNFSAVADKIDHVSRMLTNLQKSLRSHA